MKPQHIVSSDVATTLAVLKRAAATEGAVLPDDVARYIRPQDPVDPTARVLEGTLLRLMAYASLTGRGDLARTGAGDLAPHRYAVR